MKHKSILRKKDHDDLYSEHGSALHIVTIVVFSLIFVVCVLRLTHVWM